MIDPTLLPDLRWAVWLLAGVAAALLGWRAWSAARKAGTWQTRGVAVAGLSAAAILLFAAAAQDFRPWKKPPTYPRMVLLLDVSQSVLRGAGGWLGLRREILDRVAVLTADVPAENRQRIKVVIAVWGRGRSEVAEVPLADLPRRLGQLADAELVPGDASNLKAGLEQASQSLGAAPGFVLLFSDGLQTQDDAVEEARVLAARGVPIHSLPLQSGPPLEGVIASDLPAVAQENEKILLRTVIAGRPPIAGSVGLSFAPASGAPAAPAVPPQSFQLARSPDVLRIPVAFKEHGLQCVQVKWQLAAGEATACLYTHVLHTPHVLSIGASSDLVKMLNERPAWIHVEDPAKVQAKEITTGRFDAVVLDGVAANLLSKEVLEAIARTHDEQGLGLVFLNGPPSAEKTQQSLLATYEKTALEPFLPLKKAAENNAPQPDPRDNIFLIDVSSSMGGTKIQHAKTALLKVVENLGPADRLYIQPYSGEGDSIRELNEGSMEKKGDNPKQRATEYLANLGTGGGTSVAAGFQKVQQWMRGRTLQNPRFFFVTDGDIDTADVAWLRDFTKVVVAPLTETEFSGTRGAAVLRDPSFKKVFLKNGTLEELADTYFKPRPEPVWQDPTPFRAQGKPGAFLPIPQVDLPGSALAELNSGATALAIRPGNGARPVFAMRRSRSGGALALASGFSPGTRNKELGDVVWSWLESLLPTDRYRLRADLRDENVVLEIRPVPCRVNGQIHATMPDSLKVNWVCLEPNRASYSEPKTLVRANDADVFRGVFNPQPRGAMVQGTLLIDELGPGAMKGVQRIRAALPPPTAAAASNPEENRARPPEEGIALLRKLSEITGGMFQPQRLPALAPSEDAGQPVSWGLCVAGLLCYLAAIWKRDWTPWGGK